jgi:hypothetical protein
MTAQATCAATADRRVFCWGSDDMGQIAVGKGPDKALAPVDISAHLASAQPDRHEPSSVDPLCAQITAHRGYELARARCRLQKAELGLYAATVEGPDVPGGRESRPVAARDGVLVQGTGLDAFGAHMKALGAYRLDGVSAHEIALLLEAFDALPPGFTPNAASAQGPVPARFPKPGLVMQPFSLTLLMSRALGGSGGRGYAPPRWSAAILRGDAKYGFAWTLRDLGPR